MLDQGGFLPLSPVDISFHRQYFTISQSEKMA